VRVAPNESHLCCGSAGTYSVLQPETRGQLRDRKLGHLGALQPTAVDLGQHRLHHAPAKRHRPRRCGTGSRCWTPRWTRAAGGAVKSQTVTVGGGSKTADFRF
jgi:hypothetical protein